ncbi:MAG: hypothetical protein HKN44_04345 [Ilumatobacter sp.]|nr:hypothetical protein [Ilumatobacter sp.]
MGGPSSQDAAPPPTLRAAARADFRSSSGRQRLALVAVVFWVGYEWGAGNEAFTPWLIAHTISITSGYGSIPIVAAVGFGFTLLQQLVSGFTALIGFSIFERTSSAAWRRLTSRMGTTPQRWSGLGVISQTVVVFGLGTTAVVLIEIVTSGRADRRAHRATVVRSATLCALGVGLIAGAAAGVALIGRRNDSLRGTTDLVLRVLGNPLLWIGLVVVVMVVQYVKARREPDDPDETSPDVRNR